jgi:hypothetical protein
VESSVPFDIDRHLTAEEVNEATEYCMYDVESTAKLFHLRKGYFKNKIEIGRIVGIDDVVAMGMTNAKLTAKLLKATAKKYDDERAYIYPDNLRRDYIPQEVFQFFDRLKDDSIPTEQVFSEQYEFAIGECGVKLGYGGIHGAIPFYRYEKTGKRIIRNYDVASYYPHLMTIYGYTSRSIPSAKVFEDVLEQRMKAKASGDTATANALKLVVNTTYGAMLNRYNDLYDPLKGRSVCISGQLFLLELAMHVYQEIPNLRIVQLNTDGIMIEFDEEYLSDVQAICNEWQERTRFELEEDKIDKIVQKDVNNYIEVQEGGKSKVKGGYLVRGIAKAGAFNINNDMVVVSEAILNYFVENKAVEDTINECSDILKFAQIAKAGSKYKYAYQLYEGVETPIQKVNRVYATKDVRYGTLYKVKAENGQVAKIASLPEHCIIDNNNQLTVEDIDKTFYIELAQKRVNDFLGIKPKRERKPKKMATEKLNVYQKLQLARENFLASEVKKTGKNMHLAFKYFELEDIVPTATRLFSEIGLTAIMNFHEDMASMLIVNTDEPSDSFSIVAPFHPIAPNKGTNEMMALGSSITYMRRYLYMIALDICEADAIDANAGGTNTQKTAVTAPNEQANELQIKALKGALKKLREADATQESYINEIVMSTKAFTQITKADCEALIAKVNGMIGE